MIQKVSLMKVFGKFLFLLLLVVLIAFGAWKALDSTLFADEEASPSTSTVAIVPPTTEPKPLSQDEAFASTSADSTTDQEEVKLTCEVADDILVKLYDIRMNDKTHEEAITFLKEETNIPEGYIELFISLANSLWASSKNQLKSKEEITVQFNEQCLKLEQAQ